MQAETSGGLAGLLVLHREEILSRWRRLGRERLKRTDEIQGALEALATEFVDGLAHALDHSVPLPPTSARPGTAAPFADVIDSQANLCDAVFDEAEATGVKLTIGEARVLTHATRAKISAAAQAQAQLVRDERARLYEVLENLPFGVVIAEPPAGAVTFANRPAREAFGGRLPQSAAEYEQLGVARPDGTPLALADFPMIRVLLTGATISGQQIRFRYPDGGWGDLLLSAVPLRDNSGNVTAAVVSAINVSARKKLEEQRAQDLALLDGLVSAAPIGISVLDRELRFRRINEVLAQTNGVPMSETIGRTLDEVVPKLAPGLHEIYDRVFAGQRLLGVEIRGETAAAPGEPRVWNVSYFPVRGSSGDVEWAVTMVEDITARKEAESRLEETAEFRERFIAIVSHDLRNPLGAIALSATAIRKLAGLPKDAIGSTDRIAKSVERMGEMIEDLLDFTRGRLGGGIPVERAPTRFGELATRVVEELRTAHPETPIVLSLEGDDAGEWDRGRLEQVLSNLIGNAITHGAPGEPVRLEIRDQGEEVSVAVKNRGPPIDPELQPTIFDPFRRAGATNTQGLGLGLYIAKEIVAAHGGALTVRSTAEEGTCFSFRIPRSPRLS